MHLWYTTKGARGGAVGWATVLQAGRSRVRFPMVSLEFFIGIILSAVSKRNESQKYFLGVKAACSYGWQPYHLQVPTILKSGALKLLEPSGPVQVVALTWHLHFWYTLELGKGHLYTIYIKQTFRSWQMTPNCSAFRETESYQSLFHRPTPHFLIIRFNATFSSIHTHFKW